jgi:hypothetical protein
MHKNTTTYVSYLYPGSFFPETQTEQVERREPEELIKNMKNGCYAFFYHDRTTVVDDEGNEFVGETENRSKRYVFVDSIYNTDDIKKMNTSGRHDILLGNMKSNGWDKVVKTNQGNFQPFDSTEEYIMMEKVSFIRPGLYG